MSWLDNVAVGPPGPAGPAGPIGNTGEPAYTFVTAPFTQPSVFGFATIDVGSSLWMAADAYLFVATAGTYQVISIASGTQIVAMLVDAVAAPGATIAGGVVVSPSGVPGAGGGGAGPAPAIDANHLYVYACDDATGTTILNTGANPSGDLTVNSGTPIFQSGRLSRAGRSIILPATANSDRASNTSVSVSGAGLTLEAFVSVIDVPYTFGVMLCVYTAGGANAFINTHSSNGFYAQVENGGSNNTFGTTVPINYLLPTYVAMTWDYSTIKLYVNGFLRASTGCTVTPPTWDRVMLGNYGPTPVSAFKGNIMQARVSNVARSASFIMDTAETLFKM